MLIPFRRDYIAVRLILRALIAVLASEMAFVGYHASRPLLALATAIGVWAAIGVGGYLPLFLAPRRYHLVVSDRGLALTLPTKTEHVDWKDVTRVAVGTSRGTTKSLRLNFEGGSSSTRSARWIGLKTFSLTCRAFEIDPSRLIELVQSRIDSVRAAMSRRPLELTTTAQVTSTHVASAILLAMLGFSRMMTADVKGHERRIKMEVGAPLSGAVEIHDIEARRWITHYPRDPRVRLAHAEQLLDENRLDAADQELRLLDADKDTLEAFDSFGRIEAEIHSTMAAALLKRNRKADARSAVGPFCKDLADGAFERMRKLGLCHYS